MIAETTNNSTTQITFPATVAAMVLANAPSAKIHDVAQKLILTQLGILAENSVQRESYVNYKFFKNAFAKAGRWIREAAAIAKVELPLQELETSVYSEIEDSTGLKFLNMAGLISTTPRKQVVMSEDDRLVLKLAKAITSAIETPRRPYSNIHSRHHFTATSSYKGTCQAASLQN